MELSIHVPDWAAKIASDLTDMDRAPQPVDAQRRPQLHLTLPDDAYFEYAFLDAAGTMHADPRNAVAARNPWYPEVSASYGPEYRPDELADPAVPTQAPVVERIRIDSDALGQQRRLIVTTPAAFVGEVLPVVLAQDGVASYRIGRMSDVLETLVARGEARPARVAYIETVDRRQEYAFSAPYQRFVADEVVAELRRRYGPNDEWIAAGMSLGGLFSATLGLERPGLVRTILTFSGAFIGHPDERDFYGGKRSWVAETLEEGRVHVPRWYAEVGTLEWLTDVNRRVQTALQGSAAEVEYRERNAGHNWTNWRNGVAAALRFALAPA